MRVSANIEHEGQNGEETQCTATDSISSWE